MSGFVKNQLGKLKNRVGSLVSRPLAEALAQSLPPDLPAVDFTTDFRRGQPFGEYEVRVEEGDLVFEYERPKGVNSVQRKEVRDEEDYILLASLVRCRSEERVSLGSDPLSVGDERVRGYSTEDVPYVFASDEDLLAVAAKIGPLFGDAGRSSSEPIVREPKDAWLAAARVLNFCLRCEAMLDSDGERDGALDRDILYEAKTYRGGDFIFQVTKSFGIGMPEPYASLLRLCEDDRALFGSRTSFAGEFSYLPIWKEGDRVGQRAWKLRLQIWFGDQFGIEEDRIAFSGRYCRWIDEQARMAEGRKIDRCKEHTLEESIVEAIVQNLISLHVMKTSLGWDFVEEDGRPSSATLDFRFQCYLSRLWYGLGRNRVKKNVRVCEHCESIFTAGDERRSRQRFCSTQCQQRAKSLRQQRRKKAMESLADELSASGGVSNREEIDALLRQRMRPYYSTDEDFERQFALLRGKVEAKIKRNASRMRRAENR